MTEENTVPREDDRNELIEGESPIPDPEDVDPERVTRSG